MMLGDLKKQDTQFPYKVNKVQAKAKFKFEFFMSIE